MRAAPPARPGAVDATCTDTKQGTGERPIYTKQWESDGWGGSQWQRETGSERASSRAGIERDKVGDSGLGTRDVGKGMWMRAGVGVSEAWAGCRGRTAADGQCGWWLADGRCRDMAAVGENNSALP